MSNDNEALPAAAFSRTPCEPGSFEEFQKIPRLKRNCVITEKIDGTNAQVHITDEGELRVGSRSRYITPKDDNYGFARWVEANRYEIMKLGPGRHYGEWWGSGVQRGYGLVGGEKRFSLFNVGRWRAEGVILPKCVSLVPVLYEGPFDSGIVDLMIEDLRRDGSKAAPGFMKPEGIIVYHAAARSLFKGDAGERRGAEGLARNASPRSAAGSPK